MSDGAIVPHARRHLLLAGALLLVAGMALAFWYGGLFSGDVQKDVLAQLGWLAPPALVVLMTAAVVIGPIPTVPISISAGALFGPGFGFLLAMVGALAGAWISFLLARLFGRRGVAHLFGGHVSFCQHCSDRMLFWVVLGTRLVPVVSFALVSYASGFTAMSARAFMLATAIGMIPMTLLYVMAGTSLAIGSGWWIAGGALAVLLLLGLPRLLERLGMQPPSHWHPDGDPRPGGTGDHVDVGGEHKETKTSS